MKRITSLLATLLIAVVAMAQSEITFTVSSQDGTFKRGGNATAENWCSNWTSTSTAYPVMEINVSESINNMYNSTSPGNTSGAFQMAVGQQSPSTWNLTVQGYEIKSYSFKFKSASNNRNVTLIAGSKTMTSSSTEQTWSVESVNAPTASFQLSGSNFAIIVSELTLIVSPNTVAPSAMANGKVYRLVCAGSPTVSLGATAFTDVAAVTTNSEERSQQWYVTVSGDNYTFRNLANGQYLQGNNGTSEEWSLTGTSTNFTATTVNDNYVIRQVSHTNSHAYMHKDGGNNIVSWNTNAENSQWQSMEVAYTASQLQAIWDEIDEIVVSESTVQSYNTALEAIFADKACTQLNSTYAAKTVAQIQADANYLALPAVLQAMVLKVKGGDWSEANAITGKEGWSHDYAKRFRVQMYEPYSIENEVTSYLRINAHCNMDNPTGIYANASEAIYVMVDGDIADGAELWIAHQAGFGATAFYNNNAHFQLKKGLNIVPYFNDGSTLWINYVVHTYNSNGATIAEKFPENRKLSKYKPLKIHIEGGHINGYYNAMGDFRAADSGTEDLWGSVDNDEDWNYYKVRAPLNGTDAPNRDFPLLGHRQTLLFPLGQQENADGGMEQGLLHHLDNITVPAAPNCYAGSGTGFGNYSDTYYPGMGLSAGNGKINIMLEAWDRITYSELATMGVVSKSAMDRMNALYPRWTSEGTPAEIYNYGSATVNGVTQTYQEFCQGIDYSEYFNHHACGVGANSGYMSGGWRVCNYHYNTMESIIGKIANEHGPTWGPAHEIGHQHQLVFNLNGQTEVTNNFFSNVAVWYMGMGTSRVNGSEGSLESVLNAFNTDGNDLYTNNIWAIAHLYYRLWLYYHLAGNNTQFWPRLFELCRREPIVNGGQISGDTSLLRFYKHACDAAGEDLTEFFRAHGFFEIMENRVVGDYSNATYNVTQAQIDAAISEIKDKNYPANYAVLLINDATSETTKKHDGSTSRALWDNNPTAEFGSVNDFIDGDITALTGYTATVDADGSVTMSGGQGGVGFLVFNEAGELVSFSNKSNFTLNEEAMYQLATGKTNIVAVDAESNAVEAEIDMTPMQKSLLGALIADVEAMPIDWDGDYTRIGCYTKASAGELLAALESAKEILEADNGGYAAAYEILYTQKEKLIENTDKATFVPFDPSLTYNITSYAYGNTMHLNSGVKVSSAADKTANTAKWQFKTTSTDGVYNVYCLSGYYLPAATKGSLLTVVSDQASAATYTLNATDKVGAWVISVTPAGEFTKLHDDSYGKVVGWNDEVTASMWYLTAVEGTNSNASSSTDELQALIAKTETLVEEVANVSYKGKIKLQATDENDAFYITSNATESGHEPRYLLDNNVTTFFHTVWTGTSPGADHYLQIDMGENTPIDQFVFKYTNLPTTSNNVDAAETIVVSGSNNNSEFTPITTLTGLPTEKEGTYTSATLGAKGTNYRYIRLTVTDATGGTHNNHYYFGMSEFSFERVNNYSVVKGNYTTVSTTTVEATADKLIDAKTVIANGGDLSAAKAALQTAYDALYAEYNSLANSKKNELQVVIDAITAKMNEAGTVRIVKGGELELQVTDASGDYYLSTNSQEGDDNRHISKLLDGVTNNANVYFHTNWQTSVGTYHHLLLDMGTDNSLGAFKFEYTTRDNNAGIDAPRTIVVEGSDDNSSFTQIAELTGLPTGQHATYTSATLGNNATPYRYIRFRVTAGAGTVGGYAYFAMSEFDVIEEASNSITINAAYSNTAVTEELLLATYNQIVDAETLKNNTTSTELIDAQIAKLQAAQAALEKAMATKTGVEKEALQALYDEVAPYYSTAETLYGKMADGEGNVNTDYAPSTLTNEQLATAKTALDEAKTALDAAKTALDEAGVSQDDIDAAQTTLQEKYAALQASYEILLAVENANIKGSESVTNLQTLVTQINEYLSSKTVDAEKAAITMQASNENKEFYIWARETDGGNGVANLLDKNADGTANTGTFYGTTWEGGYAEYYHYIEVDMGEALSIDQLLFDYTARADRDLPGERPNNIKILGSNNKSDYTEIAILSDGMPVGQGQLWAMTTPRDLGTRYRYVRFAVASTTSNQFHMSDFNIYLLHSKVLNDYNKPSEISISALLLALEMANDLIGRHYITAAECSSINDKLTALYTEAQEAFALDVTDHTSLNELIAEIEALIAQAAMVEGVQEVAAETEAVKNAVSADAGRFMYEADYDAAMARLHTAYDELAKALVDRTALAELIEKMEALTEQIGTFNTAGVLNKITLQTTEPANRFYLWSNASDPQEGSIAHLVDGKKDDVENFFHSDWHNSVRPEGYHYLEVDLGAESINKYSLMQFAYHTRKGAQNAFPDAITVMGSNYRSSYADLYTVNEGLPQAANEASPSIAFDSKGYRYLRFKITDTEKAFWHMAEFELYTTSSTAEVRDEYVAKGITNEYAAERYDVLLHAKTIYQSGITAEEVAAATAALQTAYDELSSKLIDRSALGELIDATKALKNSMYAAEVETLTLQNTDSTRPNYLYCNAPGRSNNYTGDDLGVDALLDDNTENFLHTTYTGNGYADDKDHYLRVDLGAGNELSNFVFSYTGRSGYPELTPSKIVIEGCNEADGEYEKIAVLVNLPANTTANIYEVRGNGNAYRFIRFMVTATNGTGKYNNHPYFALSAFSVSKITGRTAELQSKYTPTLYIYSTETLLNETDATVTSAEEVYNKATLTKDEYDSALATLQVEYDKLAEAIEKYWCPVELTTDENNPVLYTINAPGRGEGKAWQYSISNNNITIVDKDANNLYHLWYFVAGTEAHTVKIVPMMTPSYKLGAADFGDAANKVSAVAESSVDWSFAYVNSNYNFKPYGRNTYLSNYGGGSNPLGFFSTADGGSSVSFTKVELENYGLARLTELSGNVYNAPVISGTEVGSYTRGEEYNGVLTTAQEMVTAATSTNEEYVAAFTSLFNGYNGLELNMPESGEEGAPVLYTITNVKRVGGKMFAGSEMEPVLYWDNNEVTAKYIFMFEPTGEEGKFYMKSLERGTYVSTALAHGAGIEKIAASKEDAIVVTIANMSNSSRAVSITPVDGAMLHADASGNANKVVAWNNTSADDASAWYIDEVTDTDNVTHPTTVNSAGVGSIMLGYTATIPEGIEAFYPKAYSSKYVTLAPYNGVLPANTAAILKVKDGYDPAATYNFTYNSSAVADDDTTAPGKATAADGVVIAGSLYTTVVDAKTHDEEMGDVNFYMFLSTKNNSKLYWVYENYLADGTSTGNNADDGYYIKVNANRAYIAIKKTVVQNLSSFSLRFDGNWGTTEIEEVENTQAENNGIDTIFDLQGRKLEEVTEPGIYIINGVKVFVK